MRLKLTIAYDGTRRIHALLHELALMMRPHTKPVAAQSLAVDDAPQMALPV